MEEWMRNKGGGRVWKRGVWMKEEGLEEGMMDERGRGGEGWEEEREKGRRGTKGLKEGKKSLKGEGGMKGEGRRYLLGGDGLLHLYGLLGDVGEGDLHGELDAVEQLDHQARHHLEAGFLLPAYN